MRHITSFKKLPCDTSKYLSRSFKAIALSVALAIASETLVFAAGSQPADWNFVLSAFEKKEPNAPVKFAADEAWTVQRKSGQDDLSVVYIEDAHQKMGAQRRIAGMIERLVTGYDLKLVSLEGASGEIDPGVVSSFPSAGARKVLGESMLRLGRVSAAEFQAMISEKPVKLYGAEEEKLYDENVEIFKRIVEKRPGINRELAVLKNTLDHLREKCLSPALSNFLKKRISLGGEPGGLGKGWEEYRALARQLPVSLKGFPSLESLSEMLDLEHSIDFAAAGAQRAELISELTGKLNRADLEKLLSDSVKYRSMKMPAAAFHASLADLAKKSGVLPDKFPDFLKYSRYLAIFESLDLQSVFSDLSRLEHFFTEKLCRTDTDRKILDLMERAELLARLLKTSALSGEYSRYLSDTERYSPAAVRGLLEELCRNSGILEKNGPAGWQTMQESLGDNLEFYKKAEDRNNALVAKTIDRMKKEKIRMAALVAGGFHSEGLSRLMDERKLSYLIVMPKFDDSEGDRPYVTVLTKKPELYEEAFKDSGFFLAEPAFFTQKNLTPENVRPILAALLVAARLGGESSDEGIFARYLSNLRIVGGGRVPAGIEETLKSTGSPRRVSEKLYLVEVGGRTFEVPVDSKKRILTGWPQQKDAKKVLPEAIETGELQTASEADASAFTLQWSSRLSPLPGSGKMAPGTLEKDVDADIARFERVKKIRFSPAQKTEMMDRARLAASLLREQAPYPKMTGSQRKINAGAQAVSEVLPENHISGTPSPATKAPSASIQELSLFDRVKAIGARLCGIAGITLRPGDPILRDAKGKIYPESIREAMTYYLYDLSRRGHHGAGLALMVIDRKTRQRTFKLVKLPNSAGTNPITFQREGGAALTDRLTTEFEREIDRIEKDYEITDFCLPGHVRLATSKGRQVKINTQPFHLGKGPRGETLLVEKTRMAGGKISESQETDEMLFAANGDLKSAKLFADGRFCEQEDLRDFFIRLYGVTSGTNDSETAAYLLHFLTTQGIWKKSLTKAFVMTRMNGPKDVLPAAADVKRWADLFKGAFKTAAETGALYDAGAKSLSAVKASGRDTFIRHITQKLKTDAFWRGVPETEIAAFAADAFDAFTLNDPYTVHRQMISLVSDDSTYGSECFFSGYPEEYVLLSRQQPVSVVHNFTNGRTVYGSDAGLAKATMKKFLASEGDDVRALRLIQTVDIHGKGGEILRVHQTEGMRLYSLLEHREIPQDELLNGVGETHEERLKTTRWAPQTNNPYNQTLISPKVEGIDDPVEADSKVIPLIAKNSLKRWADPASFSRQTFESFARDFQDLAHLKMQMMKGEAVRPMLGASDIILVSFRENMDDVHHMEKMLQSAFDPKIFTVKVYQANDFILNVNKLAIDDHTIVLFDDPSGVTFPINRGIEYAATVSERVYILANQVEGDAQAALGQQFAPESSFCRKIFTTDFAPSIDGSAAEMSAHVIEMEHIFYSLLDYLREVYPDEKPLGMTLTRENLRDLRHEFEHKLQHRLPRIVGMDFDGAGRPVPLSDAQAPEHRKLLDYSDELAPYFLEQAKVKVATYIHLFVSVFLIPFGISIIAFGNWLLSSLGISPETNALGSLSLLPFALLEAARFALFPYAWYRILRWREGRAPFHRTGTRTVVFTDPDWKLTLEVQATDAWGLSRAITDINTDNASQIGDLDDKASKVRRGTVVAMSVQPEANEPTEADRRVHGGIKSAAIVGAIQSYGGAGAMMVAVGSHKDMEKLGFDHFASLFDPQTEERRSHIDYGSPKNETAVKIIMHYSDATELLVAQSICYRWRIPAQVAAYSVPLVGKIFYWHGAGSQNSSAATTQSPLPGPVIHEESFEELEETENLMMEDDTLHAEREDHLRSAIALELSLPSNLTNAEMIRKIEARRRDLHVHGAEFLSHIGLMVDEAEANLAEQDRIPALLSQARQMLAVAERLHDQPDHLFTPQNIRNLESWQKQLQIFLRTQTADAALALGLSVDPDESRETIRRRINAKQAQSRREREALLADAQTLDLLFPDGMTNAEMSARIGRRRLELESSGSELLDKLELLTTQAACFLADGRPLPVLLERARETLDTAARNRVTPDKFFVPKIVLHLERLEAELKKMVKAQALAAAAALGIDVRDDETIDSIHERVARRRAELLQERKTLLEKAASLELAVPESLTNGQLKQRVEKRQLQLQSAAAQVLGRLRILVQQAEALLGGHPLPTVILKTRRIMEFAESSSGGSREIFAPRHLRQMEEAELEMDEFVQENRDRLPESSGVLISENGTGTTDETQGFNGYYTDADSDGGEALLDDLRTILGDIDEQRPDNAVLDSSGASPLNSHLTVADETADLGSAFSGTAVSTSATAVLLPPPLMDVLPVPPVEVHLSTPEAVLPPPSTEVLPLPVAPVLKIHTEFDPGAAREEIRRLIKLARDNGFYSVFYTVSEAQLDKLQTAGDFKRFLTDIAAGAETKLSFHSKIYAADHPKRIASVTLIADLKALLEKVSSATPDAGARLAETMLSESKKAEGKRLSSDDARLAVGVLVPRSAEPAYFKYVFSRRFEKFLGMKSDRFRLVFYPMNDQGADEAVRSMRKQRVSVILDSSSLRDPESATELLRILADFDNDAFSALYPFIARLTDSSIVDALNSAEIGRITVFLAAAFPEPAPRFVRVGTDGLVADPEVRGVGLSEDQQAEKMARKIDSVFYNLLTSQDRSKEGGEAAKLTGLMAQYLAASFREAGSIEVSANKLAGRLRGQFKTRLALKDPSYRESFEDIAAQPVVTPKTIVTDLDVFAKDGGGLPYALRMEHLSKILPGAFEHVLLVRDPSVTDLDVLHRRYPETTVFGNRVLFLPGLKDVSEFAVGGKLREDFIVLTEKPDTLTASHKPEGAQTALVLSLAEDSASTIRFLETAARFIYNPSSVPPAVRFGSHGVWVFRLPTPVPVDYLMEMEQLRLRATESAA